jgi:outer membrane receptor protein involved in Fe transport
MKKFGVCSAKSLLLGTVCLGVMMPAGNLLAQGAVLEEIVVTAQQREQRLSDVPVSVAALDGAKMEEQSMTRMEDIQFAIPNFSITETGIGTNVFIRGIGSGINQGFEQSVGMFVDGIHHGRSQQARAPFFDVERIEVLRGPQPILFGKNSVAGAVNIVSAKPTDEFEGNVNLGYEVVDSEKTASMVLSGPVTDNLKLRLAGRYHDFDGYITNTTLDRREPQQEDWTLRGTAQLDVSDDFSISLKVERSEFDTVGRNIEIANAQPNTLFPAGHPLAGMTYGQLLHFGFGQGDTVLDQTIDGNRHSNGDFSFNKQTEIVLSLDWQLGDHDVTAVSGYSGFSYSDNCDCDFTGGNVFTLPLDESYEQYSQEVRITSSGAEKFNYIVGAYYQKSNHDFSDQIEINSTSVLAGALSGNVGLNGLMGYLVATGQVPAGTSVGSMFANTAGPRAATVDTEVYSAFTQLSYDMSERITLQLGGRLTHETKEGNRNLTITNLDGTALEGARLYAPDFYAAAFRISSSNMLNSLTPIFGAPFTAIYGKHPVAGNRTETSFTPDVKIQYSASDDTMFYANWVRGRKSGGFDFRANNKGASATMEDAFQFEDELATNYELGSKMSLADGAAELNIAAFWTKFDELQVSVFDGALGFNVGNAAKAEVKGIEIDARWQASHNLTINGSVAYTDFEFKEYFNGQCYIGLAPNGPLVAQGFCDYSGQTNQLVSDWQGTIGADHVYSISDKMELRTSLDMFFTSSYNASSSNDPALQQDGYAKINARMGLASTDNGWELAILGRNLTDKKVMQFGGDAPLAGSSFKAKTNYIFMGRGRSVTIQAVKRF